MPPSISSDPAARAYTMALSLLRQIDAVQLQIRQIDQGLDNLAWHIFSIAYSVSDTDEDTKPTIGEIQAFVYQINQINADIKQASLYASMLHPICTQKNER